jgi:hypothetical protein
MTKKSFLAGTIALMMSGAALNAQVGVNTDTPKATLDVMGKPSDVTVADGFIAPRLTGNEIKAKDALYGTDQTGVVVYVTAAASPVSTKTANVTATGYYYFDGTVWQSLQSKTSITDKWFYMPSIVFDVSTEGTGFTKNLYQEFTKQLNSTAAPVIRSVDTPEAVLATVPSATDFYYYVTAYDPAVFANISINTSGVMTYDVVGAASDSTLINIVFVVK